MYKDRLMLQIFAKRVIFFDNWLIALIHNFGTLYEDIFDLVWLKGGDTNPQI